MAKARTVYVCSECGAQAAKWLGRCPDCRAWNTLGTQDATPRASSSPRVRATALRDVAVDRGGEVRVRTGIGELDNVLGGGLVAGSLVLLGGDPGVGKSTLLLTAADHLARRGPPVLYVSGEESAQQIRMRADRLGVVAESLHVLPHTDFGTIAAAITDLKPTAVILDSVQTVAVPEVGSMAGSVTQVREVAHRCMKLAKSTNIAIVLVGHITKSGDLAGPKVLEHFVDTVLYFEGDGRSSLRVLRSVKNRFGAAGEFGLFEMTGTGLREVPDASARLLAERVSDVSGTTVLAGLEGSRPFLCEIQALCGNPSPQTPARTCVGVDRTRVQMLAAVLGKAGLPLHDRDLFVNAAGGVRVTEPAADLAVLAAIASSRSGQPVDRYTLLFGEVGLVGEVRAVGHPAARLREAQRHGFTRILAPARCAAEAPSGLDVVEVRRVRDVLEALGTAG